MQLNSLPGDLVVHPSAVRPGFWALRRLADGRLLEVELTQGEWQALEDVASAAKYAKIKELNRHPLNQAAAERLSQLGVAPAKDAIHLLDLAIIAANSLGGDKGGDSTEEGEHLAGFLFEDQRAVLETVIRDVGYEPEDVLTLPLEQIAEDILFALQPDPPRD